MSQALHATMLMTSFVSVCCAIKSGPRKHVGDLLAAIAMFLPMWDLTMGFLVLPASIWALLLVVTALFLSAAATMRSRSRPTARSRAAVIHRGLGLIILAALLVMSDAAAGSETGLTAHHHGAAGPTLAIAVMLGACAYAIFATVAIWADHTRAVRIDRGSTAQWLRNGTIDRISMGLSTCGMVVMTWAFVS